ncbi:MAG: NAD(P)-dependent oxidoreductase [Clostridia bacterium]|nr:NAD(P)-dependent oxidoreductase [Clostridia bacterium]
MKTALVTGVNGFIGSALAKRLLSEGYKVFGVDIRKINDSELLNNGDFFLITTNLSENKLSSFINDKVDVLYYLSWKGSLGGKDLYDSQLQADNISMAVNVCKDSSDYCNHFIFVGSSYEHLKDSNTNREVSAYGAAKLAAGKLCENECLQKGISFNKAILTNTFGYGDSSKKAVNTLVSMMLNNQKLKLIEGNRPNDWVYIDDTIEGLLRIYEKGNPYRDYYVGHKSISLFKEKITVMRNLLCPEMELDFGTMEEKTYVDYSAFDLKALGRDTGFECKCEFKSAISKTAEWIKSIDLRIL